MLKIRGDPWNFICTIPKLSGTKVGGFLDFTTQYRDLCHITRNRKVDVCKCTWRIRMSVRMTAWAAFEVNSEAKIRNLWEARQVCMVTCSFEFESPRSLHGKNYFHFDSKTAILGWQRLTPCSLTRSGNIGKFDLVTRFPPFLENLVPNPGLFFVHFQKTQGPKNSTSKKTQGHFLPKNSICRDFLRLHIKNSMQMTSISIHFLKQMVSIDNYKEGNLFSSNK